VQTNGLTGSVREKSATIRHLDAEIHCMKLLIVAIKNYGEAQAPGSPVELQESRSVAAMDSVT
jgi:hypothetical protein